MQDKKFSQPKAAAGQLGRVIPVIVDNREICNIAVYFHTADNGYEGVDNSCTVVEGKLSASSSVAGCAGVEDEAGADCNNNDSATSRVSKTSNCL